MLKMGTANPIRVLLAGTEIEMQEIRGVLDDSAEIDIIGETCSTEAVSSLAGELSPDIVILLTDGLESCKESADITRYITGTQPQVRVVFITRNVLLYVVPALKAGAAGVLSPAYGLNELLPALRRIRQWAPYSLAAA